MRTPTLPDNVTLPRENRMPIDPGSAKMASDQSKWLATAAGTVLVLSGAILKSQIDSSSLRRECAICGGLAVVASLICLIIGSVVQAAVLKSVADHSTESYLFVCRPNFRWYKPNFKGATIGEHLWHQRIALYAGIVIVSIGFVIEIADHWTDHPSSKPVARSK